MELLSSTSRSTARSSAAPSAARRSPCCTRRAKCTSHVFDPSLWPVLPCVTCPSHALPSTNGQCDMCRRAVPSFLAYERVKEPARLGGHRMPRILIFCWRKTVLFPDAPVFHAQTVQNPQSQYGALDTTPKSTFPKVRLASSGAMMHGLVLSPDRSLAVLCMCQRAMRLRPSGHVTIWPRHVSCNMPGNAVQQAVVSHAIDTHCVVLSCAAVRPGSG